MSRKILFTIIIAFRYVVLNTNEVGHGHVTLTEMIYAFLYGSLVHPSVLQLMCCDIMYVVK